MFVMPDATPPRRGPKELPIPLEMSTNPEAAEVLRAWVGGDGLQVSIISGFERPEIWGMLLADVARHAARAFEGDGICSAEAAMERIVDVLAAELTSPTDEGSTDPMRKQ